MVTATDSTVQPAQRGITLAAVKKAVRVVNAKLHLYLGIVLGLYFVVLGLTGSLLVFGREIDRTLEAKTLSVPAPPPGTPYVPLSVVLDNFKKAYPNEKPGYIIFPQQPNGVYSIRLGPASPNQRYIYLNPYTGQVHATRTRDGSLYGVLCYIHFYLWFGQLGWDINGYGAGAVAILCGTGLYLWWPTAKAQWAVRTKVRWQGGYKKLIHDLHNVIGLWAYAILFLTALTGMAFAFKEPAKTLVYAMTGTPKEAAITVPVANASPLPTDTLFQIADGAIDGVSIYRVDFPKKPTDPWSMRKKLASWERDRANTEVKLNPYTGDILNVYDSRRSPLGRRVMELVLPLHTGFIGGLITKVIYALIGLTPLALFVTGVMKWQVKRQGQLAAKQRKAQNTLPVM